MLALHAQIAAEPFSFADYTCHLHYLAKLRYEILSTSAFDAANSQCRRTLNEASARPLFALSSPAHATASRPSPPSRRPQQRSDHAFTIV